MGSYSVVQWVRCLMGQPLYCSAADAGVWRERGFGHSSTLAWKMPWTEKAGRLLSMESRRVGHDLVSSLSLSCIGKGNGNPLQCSCLENPRGGEASWAAVHGIAQSWTRLKQLSSSSSHLLGMTQQYLLASMAARLSHHNLLHTSPRSISLHSTAALALGLLHNP